MDLLDTEGYPWLWAASDITPATAAQWAREDGLTIAAYACGNNFIRAAKFPPLGNRSYGGRRPIDLQGRGYAERPVHLICQIESPEGLEAAAEISALPGVDGLFVGPDDLALRWGESLTQGGDPTRLHAALRHVAAQCREHGKSCFSVAVTAETIALYASLGVNHLVAGVDVGFLANGSKDASLRARRSSAPPSAAAPTTLY